MSAVRVRPTEPRARRGPRGRLLEGAPRWAIAVGALALAALAIAADAGVAGPGAVPVVVRVLAAAALVFGLCGFALTRALTPVSLVPYRALLVLPVGAAACGLVLTVLGFAAVPFELSLPLTLVAGAIAAVRVGAPPGAAAERAPGFVLAGVAGACLVILALSLVPVFRSGVATVTGTGADAHQVAGTAHLLQREYPTSSNAALPFDEVRYEWRSKYPIFYALSAVAAIAGVETYEALSALAGLMLALTGIGFFLFARRAFGMGAGLAALAMALAILDRQVFHVGLHPYYNQLWGLFALPFALALAHAWADDGSRRTLALFLGFLALGAFAYPLMLPFIVLPAAGMWLLAGRSRFRRPERRSLVWMIPLGLLLAVPVFGVVEKGVEALRLAITLPSSLPDWRGDLIAYPPFGEFLGTPNSVAGPVLVLLLAAGGLWLAPRRVGVPLALTLGLALAFAGLFRAVDDGEYIYFKILAFAGPLLVLCAVAAVGRLPRPLAALGIAALVVASLAGARAEIGETYDQLTPQILELRTWSDELPEGASIRLDTLPREQVWQSYMLAEHPLGSRRPNLFFPHVPYSTGADYALDNVLHVPPRGHVGPPVRANSRMRLWKLAPGTGRDTTSRAQSSYLGRIRAGDPELNRLFPVIPDPTR